MVAEKEEKKPTVEELLAKAKKLAQIASPLHRFYEGKMQVMPKCAITSPDDFAVWYTPGVAAPCREIQQDWVKSMQDDAVVFACANPIPEIWPWEAEEAGARIVATGRNDFPNQVNNSLGFPGIFRGVLDVKAKTITDDMCIAAAQELARFAEERGMHEKDILPRMEEWEVFPREAVACALKSIEQGVARIKLSRQELYERASAIIRNARESTEQLMKQGLIKPLPSEKAGKGEPA